MRPRFQLTKPVTSRIAWKPSGNLSRKLRYFAELQGDHFPFRERLVVKIWSIEGPNLFGPRIEVPSVDVGEVDCRREHVMEAFPVVDPLNGDGDHSHSS